MTRSSSPGAFSRIGRRALAVALYVLPAALIFHATTFWGRGIIDKEALTFVINYLAGRPLLATIFDPKLNDWGLYQARELSYVFDFLDARVFAALLDRRILVFVPVSGVVGLIAVAGLYLWGARKVLHVDGVAAALLLSLFLSCIVTQASTAVFYRSSKIALSVAMLAFLFQLSWLLRESGGGRRASGRNLTGLFLLGLVMSMCDRQGFYYLVVAAAIAAVLWWGRWLVAAANACAILAATLYNYVVAPRIIHALNGYWPDFTYQQVPPADFVTPWTTLARQAWLMFQAQTRYFFGNAPFVAVGLTIAIGCAAAAWRARSSRPLLLLLATAGSLVVLLAVMILRHSAVYEIPDHAFWYYTLTVHVVFLFGATLLVVSLGGIRSTAGRLALYVLLLLMIGNNLRHYQDQRTVMINSRRWFKAQYEHSDRFVNDFEVMHGGSPTGPRSPASWLRVTQAGAVVALPIRDQGFLDGVQAAYATLVKRRPLVDATGPYWSALRGFLQGAGSPLTDPEQMGTVLEAFQAIGVRRVVLDRDRYEDQELARATAAALLISPMVVSASDDGHAVTVDLTNAQARPAERNASWRLPDEFFRLTASHAADRLPLVLDGNADTRWISGSRQTGDEWIRIEFDVPRDVARLRLDLAERSFGDYPRALLIASENGDQVRTLYQGSPLGALMKGLLREPDRAPIEVSLPPNRTKVLVVRQTGQTRVWFWSIHELSVWER